MSNKWIPVDGYKNLPVGVWLVTVDDAIVSDRLQVAVVHPNIAIIGNNFGFDMKPVIAYMPLPDSYIA